MHESAVLRSTHLSENVMYTSFACIASASLIGLCALSSSVQAGDLRDIAQDFEHAYSLDNPAAAAAAVADLYANNALLRGDAFGDFALQGRDAIEQAEASLFSAFCNTDWVATNIVHNGNRKIAIEYNLSADFCGPFPGPDGELIQPTGKRFTLKLATFIKINNAGRIVEEYRHANISAFNAALLTP